MQLVIELARRNVAMRSGGPFAAGVFDAASGGLIAPGVNLVVASDWSGGHAEMIALALAQRVLKSHDLGADGLPACELVSSAEPCAMCLGAVVWSGVRSLVCSAREADTRSIGFDEGPRHVEWIPQLEQRGIAVTRDVCRDEAVEVLRVYAAGGGPIYGPRHDAGSGHK